MFHNIVLRVMLGRVRFELTGERKLRGEESPSPSVTIRRCPVDIPALHVAAPRLHITLAAVQCACVTRLSAEYHGGNCTSRSFSLPTRKWVDPTVNVACMSFCMDVPGFPQSYHVSVDGFGGLVVSMLASGTQVCGFKPG